MKLRVPNLWVVVENILVTVLLKPVFQSQDAAEGSYSKVCRRERVQNTFLLLPKMDFLGGHFTTVPLKKDITEVGMLLCQEEFFVA